MNRLKNISRKNIKIVLLLFIVTACEYKSVINSGWIGCVKYLNASPDGKTISVQGDGYIYLFDGNSFRQKTVLKFIDKPINSVFISNDELLVFGSEGSVIYNLNTQKTKPFSQDIYSIGKLDVKGDRLFLLTSDILIQIYESKTRKLIATKELDRKCTSINTSNNYIIVGYENGDIELINKLNLSVVSKLVGHKTKIESLSVDETETFLISGSSRDYDTGKFGEAILWNIKSGTIIFRTNDEHKQVLSTYIDSKNKVYVSSMSAIVVYNLKGQIISNIPSDYNDPVFIYNNGKIIFGIADIGHMSDYLYVVNTETYLPEKLFSNESRQIWDLNFYEKNLIVTKGNEVSIINDNNEANTFHLFSNSESTLFKGNHLIGIRLSGQDHYLNELFLFDLKHKTNQQVYFNEDDLAFKISHLDFIKLDGIIYYLTNTILCNLTENKKIADFTIPPLKDTVHFADITGFIDNRSPVRKFILNSNLFYEFDFQHQILNIREVKTGKYVQQIPNVYNVISQDGQFIYLINSNSKLIETLSIPNLKLNTDVLPRALIQKQAIIDKLKYSNNRNMIAIKHGEFGNISIINLEKSTKIDVSPSRRPDCFEFSPNNKYLLIGNRDGEIEIWDASNGSLMGVVFTGSMKNDFVIIFKSEYDGTKNGIEYFINKNQSKNLRHVEGLFEDILLK